MEARFLVNRTIDQAKEAVLEYFAPLVAAVRWFKKGWFRVRELKVEIVYYYKKYHYYRHGMEVDVDLRRRRFIWGRLIMAIFIVIGFLSILDMVAHSHSYIPYEKIVLMITIMTIMYFLLKKILGIVSYDRIETKKKKKKKKKKKDL